MQEVCKLILIAIVPAIFIAVRVAKWPSVGCEFDIIVGVALIWPIGERLVHRFVMHGPKWAPFYYTHKWHHDHPTGATGLPPWFVIALYYFIAWRVTVRFGPEIHTLMATVFLGLAVYELVHFLVHSEYRPRTWIGWAIRANHLSHHHDQQHAFGMLCPIFKPSSNKKAGSGFPKPAQ